MEFKIGDIVRVINCYSHPNIFLNKVGKIIGYYPDGLGVFAVKFKEKYGGQHNCNGMDPTKHSRYFNKNEIKHFDLEKQKELEKKREEMKDKIKDIDPYGEEDWLDESKLNEYFEFRKIGGVYKVRHFYDEFEDYIIPFLKKGEWYRIKCKGLLDKKISKSRWIVPVPVMATYVIKILGTKLDPFDNGYILYNKRYNKGEIEDVRSEKFKDFYNCLQWVWFDQYKDVVIEHIGDPETLKRKEEMKDKMKDIDPFGEEDWLDVTEKIINFKKFIN